MNIFQLILRFPLAVAVLRAKNLDFHKYLVEKCLRKWLKRAKKSTFRPRHLRQTGSGVCVMVVVVVDNVIRHPPPPPFLNWP